MLYLAILYTFRCSRQQSNHRYNSLFVLDELAMCDRRQPVGLEETLASHKKEELRLARMKKPAVRPPTPGLSLDELG